MVRHYKNQMVEDKFMLSAKNRSNSTRGLDCSLAVQENLRSEYLSFMPPRMVFEKSGSPFCGAFEEQFRIFWKCQKFPREWKNGNSNFRLALSAVSDLAPGEQIHRSSTTWATQGLHLLYMEKSLFLLWQGRANGWKWHLLCTWGRTQTQSPWTQWQCCTSGHEYCWCVS